MNVRLLLQEGILTARLQGEIDHHSAGEIRDTIDEASQNIKPRCLRLDFSEVPFMDSSGIGLILGRVKLYKFWGGQIVICGLTRTLLKMVELSGIASVAVLEKEAG